MTVMEVWVTIKIKYSPAFGDTQEDGGGTDDKGQEVSDRGDGDADSSAGQSLAQDLRHVLDRLLLDIAREVLAPRGHQQEHVVHADP